MKKTYTFDEVIDLFNQYQNECGCEEYEGWSYNKTFEQWLKEKEQSSIPVKGQMIWVRDNGGEWFTRDYPMWTIHKTHKMISPIAITTSILGAIEVWDEYSLTNPNQ